MPKLILFLISVSFLLSSSITHAKQNKLDLKLISYKTFSELPKVDQNSYLQGLRKLVYQLEKKQSKGNFASHPLWLLFSNVAVAQGMSSDSWCLIGGRPRKKNANGKCSSWGYHCTLKGVPRKETFKCGEIHGGVCVKRTPLTESGRGGLSKRCFDNGPKDFNEKQLQAFIKKKKEIDKIAKTVCLNSETDSCYFFHQKLQELNKKYDPQFTIERVATNISQTVTSTPVNTDTETDSTNTFTEVIQEFDPRHQKRFAKYINQANNGNCVDPIDPNEVERSKDILKRHRFGYKGNLKEQGGTTELHGLAEVLHVISGVGDGRFKKHYDMSVSYQDKVKFWYQDKVTKEWYSKMQPFSTCRKSTLLMAKSTNQNLKALNSSRKNCGHGRNNSVHIAHELAHCFGWKKQNGEVLYESYAKKVPSRTQCSPTWYSSPGKGWMKDRNEEFAEIFTLYLFYPDILQQIPGCKPALEFFANVLGETGPPEDITCTNRRRRLRRSVAPSSPAESPPGVTQ